MIPLTADIETHWVPIAPLLSLRTEQDYDAAVVRLNSLVDVVGTDEDHPLYSLLDTLGTLVHAYEEQHVPIVDATGPEELAFLMEEHSVATDQLPEIGDRAAVDDYLAGKAELSVRQLRALARRFRISSEALLN